MATQLVPASDNPAPVAIGNEAERFGLMQRKAQLFAASPLIPDALRAGGAQQALANCYIGLTMAEAMGENPLTVLQNIHIVKGKAGFSAQFMIARANASGVFRGRINWRMTGQGDTLCAEAFATLAETGEEVSFAVDMGMARAEGWMSNPKYKSVPHLMLRYRSATFLVRLYAPDVMFGYQTAEEVQDMAYAEQPPANALTGAMLIEQAKGEIVDAEPVNDGTLSDDNPAATEGRTDDQHGDQFDGTDDAPAYAAWLETAFERIAAATKPADLRAVESDPNKDALPDDVLATLEEAIADKRKALLK